MTDLIASALAAEREGRMLDCLALAVRAVDAAPGDPDALALMARMCRIGDDIVGALDFALRARAERPGDSRLELLVRDLIALPCEPDAAERLYAQALARIPALADSARTPASVPRPDGLEGAIDMLKEAVRANPAGAAAHAALGRALAFDGRLIEAHTAYRRAVLLAPDVAAYRLAFGELAHRLNRREEASEQLEKALALSRVFEPPGEGRRPRVLVLVAPGYSDTGLPIDFFVDGDALTLIKFYVEPGVQTTRLPAYDVVFSALSETEAQQPFIEAAARFIDGQTRPAINHPKRLWATSRARLAEALAGIDGVRMARTRRVPRGDAAPAADELGFPLIVRPVDGFGGRGTKLVTSSAGLADAVAATPGEHVDLSEFIEYRSPDGFYRKYRVMLIDGRPFPFHLAISPNWLVHYFSAPMAEHAWMRAEEERFLRRPAGSVARWADAFAAIAARLDVDVFGIDCSVDGQGRILVFEADAASFIHRLDTGTFAYRTDATQPLFEAIERLIRERAEV